MAFGPSPMGMNPLLLAALLQNQQGSSPSPSGPPQIPMPPQRGFTPSPPPVMPVPAQPGAMPAAQGGPAGAGNPMQMAQLMQLFRGGQGAPAPVATNPQNALANYLNGTGQAPGSMFPNSINDFGAATANANGTLTGGTGSPTGGGLWDWLRGLNMGGLFGSGGQ